MEKIVGQTLLDIVLESGPFNESMAAKMFEQILRALKYMHSKGVVHRDMNPTNVFLTDGYKIKVLDFNVSKLVEKVVL